MGQVMAVFEPARADDASRGPVATVIRLLQERRVRFLIVGGLNTVIGFGLFVGFHHVFGNDFLGYMSALVLANALAMIVAFTLHRRFVFEVRGQVLLDLARFVTVNLGMLGTNAVLLPFLVEVVGLPVVPAQVVATVGIVVVSYLGHSLFSFRRPADVLTHDEDHMTPVSDPGA